MAILNIEPVCYWGLESYTMNDNLLSMTSDMIINVLRSKSVANPELITQDARNIPAYVLSHKMFSQLVESHTNYYGAVVYTCSMRVDLSPNYNFLCDFEKLNRGRLICSDPSYLSYKEYKPFHTLKKSGIRNHLCWYLGAKNHFTAFELSFKAEIYCDLTYIRGEPFKWDLSKVKLIIAHYRVNKPQLSLLAKDVLPHVRAKLRVL